MRERAIRTDRDYGKVNNDELTSAELATIVQKHLPRMAVWHGLSSAYDPAGDDPLVVIPVHVCQAAFVVHPVERMRKLLERWRQRGRYCSTGNV